MSYGHKRKLQTIDYGSSELHKVKIIEYEKMDTLKGNLDIFSNNSHIVENLE
jgi:hypothetical protein